MTISDPFGRQISYLRLSVTDRCDLRCRYCMGDDVEFLPKDDLLTLEEMERLCAAFIRLGVRKLRLTGGEPLLRRGIMTLIEQLGEHVAGGRLNELVLTTNGTRLRHFAQALRAAGMRRVNVSLDTLSAEIFRHISRGGNLSHVLAGIQAAKEAGLQVKINTVVLKGVNEECFDSLIAWCGEEGFDMSMIEVMPMGEVGAQRSDQYLPLTAVRQRLERRWTLSPDSFSSLGPARYVTVAETGRRLGFITPMSHDFCGTCNRVRLSASGKFYPCLGHDRGVDLLAAIRHCESDQPVERLILEAIGEKPSGHGFAIDMPDWRPSTARRMSDTGG